MLNVAKFIIRLFASNPSDAERIHAQRALYSYRCECGAKKRPGFGFCKECFFALPFDVRCRLSRTARRGFVLAYREALPLRRIVREELERSKEGK